MRKFPRHQFHGCHEPIQYWAESSPAKTAVIFVRDDASEDAISFSCLHQNAQRYASFFTSSSIKPGDRIILALSHSPDLLYAFWGCLYMGALPSIYSYKSPMQTLDSFILRLIDRINETSARMVVLPVDLPQKGKPNIPENCQISTPDHVPHGDNKISPPAYIPISEEETANLQFTSGSSGKQKGVMISHRAILNLVLTHADLFEIQSDDVVLNWLPLAHDFGLFSGHIIPVACGILNVLMSPFKWLGNPGLYLELIERYRATITFLPNSGLQHILGWCEAKKPEKSNLGSLKFLLNGSEPIYHSTIQEFYHYFRSWGLEETAMANGYGMAENTLGVSCTPIRESIKTDWIDPDKFFKSGHAMPVVPSANKAKAIVSCGKLLDQTSVTIISENGETLPQRRIGEILVNSPTLFSGYYNNTEEYEKTMKNGWYHTGDLGYTVGDDLYICGRKKNIIIIGGQNIYPEDLERSIISVFNIQIKNVLALGMMDDSLGTEKIVIIAELNQSIDIETTAGLKKKIRQRVYTEFGYTLADVCLVEKRWIKKTVNGKIDRQKNLDKYLKTKINA